jgi:hypothetical protein
MRAIVSGAILSAQVIHAEHVISPDTEELEYCGEVELDITEQDATVRYLSEGKWGYGTSSESLEYYGRDEDVTLTCWTDGDDVNGNRWV